MPIAAGNLLARELERGEWATQVEQLKLWEDEKADSSGHGRKRGKNVISAVTLQWHSGPVNGSGALQ
jgi:hypothetical protein